MTPQSRVGVIIFIIALLLSTFDLFFTSVHSSSPSAIDDVDDFDELKHDDFGSDDDFVAETPQQSSSIDEDDVQVRPVTSFGETASATLKFVYCVSCGYRQAFDEFSRIIQEKYPSFLIEGANYPPSFAKAMIAQVLGFVKIAFIVAIITGRDPFTMLGMATPSIVQWALNNKLSACMMLFLLGNTIESSLTSTAAFEIYFNDQLVWSKLESGRVPSPSELIQIIDSQLEMSGARTDHSTFVFDAAAS